MLRLSLALVALTFASGCLPLLLLQNKPEARTIRVAVRAYCPCEQCCGKKAQGLTAKETDAYSRGAATDWTFLPAGTRLTVPGYGRVVVDDTGGALRQAWRRRGEGGVEVRFLTHAEARAWGVQELDVDLEG